MIELKKELVMHALHQYSTADLKEALEENYRIIAEKPPRTLATSGFWKALENRLKLRRELAIRGESEDAPVPLPEDHAPIITIDG